MCVLFQHASALRFTLTCKTPSGRLSLVDVQVAELKVQLALVTSRLHALEAAAGQGRSPATLLAPDGGAAVAASAPDGLQTPRALSLGQGVGEQAPLCSALATSHSVPSKLTQLCVRRLASCSVLTAAKQPHWGCLACWPVVCCVCISENCAVYVPHAPGASPSA